MSATLLIADIGGTNARFALADPHAATPLLDDSVREFAVADFPSLADAARSGGEWAPALEALHARHRATADTLLGPAHPLRRRRRRARYLPMRDGNCGGYKRIAGETMVPAIFL